MKHILVSIVNQLSSLGHLGIFLAMSIESMCIPLPSELTLPLAGYMVFLHKGTLLSMTVVSTLGCLFGSLVAYVIGYFGGRPFIMKYGKYILISEKDLSKADSFFDKHGQATIFFSRLLPVIRTFISLPAGIAKMNVFKFSLLSLLGSLPWCFLFVFLGEKFGENYSNVENYFKNFNYIIIIGVIAIVVFFILWKIRERNKKNLIKNNENDENNE
jgi:membrane protein DedA with SNARE-associated domain